MTVRCFKYIYGYLYWDFDIILKNLADSEQAKDIVQDTFEKLWKRYSQVDYNKSKSYLYTTAYHTMIDIIRKEKRMEYFSQAKAGSYSHSKQYSDLQEILHEALQRLPGVQRTVILLRDYEGYTYAEIGEITGLSESQVKVYIYRGRVFLKQYIGSLQAVI